MQTRIDASPGPRGHADAELVNLPAGTSGNHSVTGRVARNGCAVATIPQVMLARMARGRRPGDGTRLAGMVPMPIRTNFLERMAFALDRAPALMLDYLGAQAFQVFAAARRLGVFAALTGGPLRWGVGAARRGADPHATDLLLRTLATIGSCARAAAATSRAR